MGGAVHRFLAWAGTLTTVVVLVFAAALWRLMQGPIDLDQLTPYVQEMFDRTASGLKIVISGGHFGLDPDTHTLELSFEGVRLTQADGEPIATFPVLSTHFSLTSLLNGKIAPTRLVIQRPVLRFVRDEDGAVHFRFGDHDREEPGFSPGIFEEMAGPAKPGEPLGLLRRLVIRDATLVLDDRQTGVRWQANHVDATSERSREGLAGDLSMALAVGGRKPEFRATYHYSSVDQKIGLAVEVGAVEPAAFASLAPELAPLEAAQFPIWGSLATSFDLAGRSSEGVRVDVRFGKGLLKSELLPEGALALQEGSLRAVYAPESNQLRLAKLEFDLGGGSTLSFKGSLDGVTPAMMAGKDPGSAPIPGKLAVSLSDVPVNKFESLWPPAISRNGRRWVLTNIHDGVLDEGAVALDLEVDPATRSAEVVSAHGSMRYHDATITYFHGLVPARKVGGIATLDDRRLVFTLTTGVVKSIRLTGGSLQITDLGAPIEWLTSDLSMTGPIQDFLEVIDAKPLRYAHDIGVDPARVAGRSETNIHFKLPLLKELRLAQVEYAVKASLTGAGIADVAMHRNLTDGNLAVEIGSAGAHLRGVSRFDGVPLNLDADLFFKPKNGARGRYRVTTSLSDEQRRRLEFDFFPNRLTGPIGLDVTYWFLDPTHAQAEAGIDLQAATLSVPEASWKKPRGEPGSAKFTLDLHNEQITRIRDIGVEAAGLDGRLAMALVPGTEQVDRVDVHRLVIGNDDLAGSITRRREGGWNVELRGPTLDLSYSLKDIGRNNSWDSAAGPPLQINARIGRVIVGPGREVRDVRALLLREGADWQTAQIDARFANGRMLSLRSGKETGKPSLTFQSDDLGSAMSLLNITDNIVGGRVTITGRVADGGGKQVVSGRLEGGGYSLVRAPAFARILSLPSFSGAGSLLSGSGIPFSTLRGDFVYAGTQLSLENLVAYGEAIGVTANGVVDLNRDELALRGTIVPAYALNSILANIPVIGSLLLGGDGQGLFAANYQAIGPVADPQVSVNPLSALAPGFLRRLFQPNFGVPPPVQQSLGGQ
jgi:hypothetical protein